MTKYIHGRTREREIARLEKQAAFVAPWFLADFEVEPGMHVLDLGTGIGAMARELKTRFPDIALCAVDLSVSQLAVAQQRHPVARYAAADAARLPFRDATFDRVHASWLLEHVPAPEAVVREVARVLKKGGIAWFVEVDNASLRTEPHLPSVTKLMRLLDEAQSAAGGDPYIGRRLAQIFGQAGFSDLSVRAHPLIGSNDTPVFFASFVEEFAEILESVEETLAAEGALIAQASAELRGLLGRPSTSLHYTPMIARAVR